MIYESEKMTLKCVMKAFNGNVNDVEICEDLKGGRSMYYTLLCIKKHETVKKLMNIIEGTQKDNKFYVDMFDSKCGFCMVFGYVKERKLNDFFMARDISLECCEDICLNLIVQCMTSGIPYPLLELILKQRQLQLLRDNSIALSYTIDLEDLNENCTEADCVMQCALIVRDLLGKKVSRKNVSYTLLSKKIPKKSYASFRELYKDIRLCSSMLTKQGILTRAKAFVIRNATAVFRMIIIVCIVLIVFSAIVFASRAIWGDVPLLRFFMNTFKTIGTESLCS